MLIEKIIINNFRVYKGINELILSTSKDQNVSIISGNNGFGKTSLLTSLVWGLYGKLMVDVDERYRKEIYESGGYKRFCEKTINRAAVTEIHHAANQARLEFAGDDSSANAAPIENIRSSGTFSVAVCFTQLMIPSLPCERVQITRTYNIENHQETVEILIDGRPNELTREVGDEIFIHDFILPKEIAKFFFFDAEKIVSLAEIRTTEEKRSLSQAYGEVLGIKKYLDLKENLQNLRLRLRKKSVNTGDEKKLDKLSKQLEELKKQLAEAEKSILYKTEKLTEKRFATDKLQASLIREGTAMTLGQLKDLQERRDELTEEGARLKNRFRDMMELAPFAIAANKLTAVIQQLESEQELNDEKNTAALLRRKNKAIENAIKENKKKLALDKEQFEQLLALIEETLIQEKKVRSRALLNFSEEQHNQFMAVYGTIEDAFSRNFRLLIADQKKQVTMLSNTTRRLQDSESKEEDPVIMGIRNEKIQLDNEIMSLEKELIELKAQKISWTNEYANLEKQYRELTKAVKIGQSDVEKDEIAARLIDELEVFIQKLKIKKKASLEKKILKELKRLMHKATFVSRVDVIIEGDLIDIELYDYDDQVINKEGLSKGEQQLYATALLKALADESNIRFPVFIDSPLQKFDQEHARNIVVDFYPNIAGQVVLFPLLEKELNEKEYDWLLPRVGKTYLINQVHQYQSQFKPVQPDKLFKVYRKIKEHVHEHQNL